MPIEITMPRLSDTMEAGTVVTWHADVGDTVSAGDVIADIETDKATMELQAFDDGTLARRVVEEGQRVAVGDLIAILAEEGESVEDAAGAASSSSGDQKGSSPAEQRAESADGSGSESGMTATQTTEDRGAGIAGTRASDASSNGSGTAARNGRGAGRIFASPLARKIAQERGVDLSNISGSGPSGRIVRRDVEDAGGAAREPSRSVAPAPMTDAVSGAGIESRHVPLSNMRATIAKRLVESKQTVPHYQVTVEAEMDALIELRAQLNTQLESQGVKLSVNDFLVRACALAMHEHPFVNASWGKDGQSVQIHGDINIGVAIALPIKDDLTGGGLVVATLRAADRLGLRQISAETRRLATKAREKGLTLDEMSDSTFTISNLGMYGVSHFTAIINPPNAAILAVGAAEQRAVVRNGEVVPRRIMTMTMSSDHRIVDGAMAAQYLATVKGYLESPAAILV